MNIATTLTTHPSLGRLAGVLGYMGWKMAGHLPHRRSYVVAFGNFSAHCCGPNTEGEYMHLEMKPILAKHIAEIDHPTEGKS